MTMAPIWKNVPSVIRNMIGILMLAISIVLIVVD